MRTVQRTCLEVLVIGVIGLALGFAANGVRARGQISPTKNYFATGPARPAPEQPVGVSKDGAAGSTDAADHQASEPPAAANKATVTSRDSAPPPQDGKTLNNGTAAAKMAAPPAADGTLGGKKLKHDYQPIEFDPEPRARHAHGARPDPRRRRLSQRARQVIEAVGRRGKPVSG